MDIRENRHLFSFLPYPLSNRKVLTNVSKFIVKSFNVNRCSSNITSSYHFVILDVFSNRLIYLLWLNYLSSSILLAFSPSVSFTLSLIWPSVKNEYKVFRLGITHIIIVKPYYRESRLCYTTLLTAEQRRNILCHDND